MTLPVALYVPNLLGYARISLAFAGLQHATNRPATAVGLWIGSGLLDLFDGILARLLRQTSSMGVFLDVAADNILRTIVWVSVAIVWSPSSEFDAVAPYPEMIVPSLCCAIVCLEWTTMVATQVHAVENSQHWKEARRNDPWIIRTFFASNFRNPLGVLGFYGLFAANLFAFGYRHPVIHSSIPQYDMFMYIAFLGRLLSAAIEIYFCASYFSYLVQTDGQRKRSD